MIINSHCHAWEYWPYEPPVPDLESRGRIEQLINQMDINGVQQTTIISAQNEHNPKNNDYIADAVRRDPSCLYQYADVDCSWSDTYHTPGASSRMEAAIEQWPMKGFTHYLRGEDDGSWLTSQEGWTSSELQRMLASSRASQVRPTTRPRCEMSRRRSARTARSSQTMRRRRSWAVR